MADTNPYVAGLLELVDSLAFCFSLDGSKLHYFNEAAKRVYGEAAEDLARQPGDSQWNLIANGGALERLCIKIKSNFQLIGSDYRGVLRLALRNIFAKLFVDLNDDTVDRALDDPIVNLSLNSFDFQGGEFEFVLGGAVFRNGLLVLCLFLINFVLVGVTTRNEPGDCVEL